MPRQFIAFMIFALLVGNSSAGINPGSGPDAAVSSGISSRAQSLADAACALTGEALSVFYNPAANAVLNRTEIDLHYSQPFADITDCDKQALALAYPLILETGVPGMSSSLGTISLSLVRFHMGGVPEADESGLTGRLFGETTMLSQISYATHINRLACLGLNLKTLSHKVDNRSGGGFGIDLGFLWTPRNLVVGLTIANAIAPEVRLGDKGDAATTRFRLGTAYSPIGLVNIILEGETDIQLDYDAAAGLEIFPFAEYNNLLSIRSGYRLSTQTWSAGIGINLDGPFLDLAYFDHADLGAGQAATVGWRIAPPPPKPKVNGDENVNEGEDGTVEVIEGTRKNGVPIPGGKNKDTPDTGDK